MNIAYVAPYYSEEISIARRNRTYRSPAALNKMRGMVAALDSAGCTVTVVSPVLFGQRTCKFFGSSRERLGNSKVIYPSTWDVPVFGILGSIIATFIVLAGLKRVGQAERVIFYNFVLPTAVPAYLARIFLGIPVVVEYEDGLFADPDIPRTKRLISLLLEKTGKFLVSGGVLVSATLADRLRTNNSCVCRGFFHPLPEGEGGAERVILYAGRFDRARGIDIFLDAVSRLTEKARVVITGYGPLERLVRDRVASITTVPIDLHGFLPPEEFRRVLAAADILVNPQRGAEAFGRASFPSKVYEYMSAGKVVISSRVADIEDIAEGRLLLYDGDSPEALATLLDVVLARFEVYRPYGVRARRWIAGHCTPEAVGKEIRRVLERA